MDSRKSVLFIGLDYHHYTRAILDEIRLAGFDVTNVDIQPRTLAFKIFKTVAAKRYQAYLDRHHRAAIDRASALRYDHVVFLQAHQISLENLARLRQTQPQAVFTLYNWDSLDNHDYLAHTPHFDRVLTFDYDDAQRHGFGYLPLFCVRPIQAARHDRARPFTVSMVGNIVNLKRYEAVQAFAGYCDNHGIQFDRYLVVSPVVLWRLLMAGIRPKGLHFRTISPQLFARMTEDSLAVFDYANHQQSGYTMRTIENLCAGKKIITNNKRVETDWFYSPDRFHCFEGFDFQGVRAFLETPIAEPERRFEEFHVQTFTRRLLGPGAEAELTSTQHG
ncbi:hypothetical protein GETHLI_27750 [Geothrix limicola]|uniref:Lipopolysaccharide biosynthesis protein n=1 Tax=Geothrix limicola TaxID=2927978 RepID=A0ABQ5QHW6_9BACT|nr:hypothetical protein [Geothrix limicola]GLH74273.1 hypothetical protein GETHLI_27750 [Geothrix limicola]